jgi:hypothetical protein
VESALVIEPARSLDAVGHASVQTIETPLREGHADYGDLEDITFHHGIERREDHLVSEIARNAEEHQSVRTSALLCFGSLVQIVLGTWRRAHIVKSAHGAEQFRMDRMCYSLSCSIPPHEDSWS